jgi:hypothetical protein
MDLGITIGEATAIAYVVVYGGMWVVYHGAVWLGYLEDDQWQNRSE